MPDDLDLSNRGALPDALRVLLQDFPREDWERHPHFAGLVQFWLDRHLMFRRLGEAMTADTQAMVDGNMADDQFRARLARLGGMFVNQLHGHHQIEDHHYFPVLSRLDTRLERGFEILDHDHHTLDAVLERFTGRANEVLQGKAEPGKFLSSLDDLNALLDRHLEDEEDLIVPVILKHGPHGLE